MKATYSKGADGGCGGPKALGLALLAFGLSSCSKPELPAPLLEAPKALVADLERFTGSPIGKAFSGKPWVGHLIAVDLDQDGRLDVVACESLESEVVWLRQNESGGFDETVLAKEMRGPVHVEAVDLDRDGDLDLLVSSMSVIFPNNDRIGTLIALENDGSQRFAPRYLLENVARVTDARAADFNGDGRLDIVVGQFGYDQGEIRWLEQTGPWEFASHPILDLSGTINVCVADFDGDGDQDFAAQISQQWEEAHLFSNDGKGNFERTTLFGSTNEDFASSGMTAADLNQDGRMDLIFVNGDGFGPTPFPGPRPWHGVQWLENRGGGKFAFHRIGDLAGAYSPAAADIDGDGDLDVVAVSAFNEWHKPESVSMMWYENDGKLGFSPRVLAHAPTHLLAIAVADFDGSGRPSIVSGAFHCYPPYERMSRLMIWRQRR